MGDLQAWSSQPNGILTEEGPVLSSLSSSPGNSQPLPIRDENWSRAEQTTEEIIHRIQPTVVSEQRRRDVIDYVQRLIGGYLRSEVFPFGSVPLKTYLPDGDIDLTALSNQNAEDALASDVRSVLEGEGQNEAAEFEVKDVQYIHAEVKLVKCLVQNIVVDISFNQLGGLCTLCFLETVDNLIGKDHLFKRSIILIKAWCYYESRILGAHHGLISTYALETLVLYIFHLFHSSLNGPLAVLYRFLDYFSKFDWDNYCISLSGPVTISSLPEIVAETAENGGGDLLLSKEFLRSCVDKFSVPSRGLETSSRAFPQKHLNIVDPLKENNNLGRSVSKGNFYRIRSAFTYGARKLGRILLLPGKSMEDELKKFFMNTLDRHGSGQRPDVQDPVPTFAAGGYDPALLKSSIENRREDRVTSESPSIDSSSSVGTVCERISNINISEAEKKPGSRTANEAQRYSTNVSLSQMLLEPDGSANGNAVSGYRLAGDAEDLATFGILSPRNTIETPKSTPLSSKSGTPPFGKVHYAPHLYFPRSFPENGKLGNGNSEQRKPVNSGIIEKVSSRLACLPDEGTDLVCYSGSNHEDANSVGSTNGLQIPISAACTSEDLYLGYQGRDMAGTSGSSEALCYLSDLRGDYDSHFNSLMHCRWFHELAFSGGPVLPISPSPSQVWNKHARDAFYRSVQYKQNMFPHVNANGVVRGPPFYPGNPSMVSSVAFGAEEMPKPRGTGTYFPNTNHHSYRERSSHGRGKNPTPLTQGQLQRPSRNNGRVGTLAETDLVEKGSQELSQAQAPVFVGRQKPDSLELFQSAPSTMKGFPHANGLAFPSERLEFGSFGHPPLGAQSPETSRQLDSGTPYTQGSLSSLPTSAMQRLRPGLGINQERVAVQPYHLKNDDDFPPLSN